MSQTIKKLTDELYTRLGERGYRCRITSVQHLKDLCEEINARNNQGLLDRDFYRKQLTFFSFKLPENLPEAKSLIVVTVPQPQIQVIFNWKGKAQPLILPPTYLHYPNRMVQDLLSDILEQQGYHATPSLLPEKLLAARAGLCFYGKNNVCYAPGMGSFHRPMAFYSDLPPLEDNWQESIMLEDCENCSACVNACPTGAIIPDRFLIRAERCLTFVNESPGDFPDWLNPSWNECLVGCLRCQRVCPQNRDFLDWIQPGAEFSEEETASLLNGVPFEKLPAETVKKLERLDMMGYHDVLPRNLRVLLK